MASHLQIDAPVYYVKQYKTKKNKTMLISMNTMRVSNHYLQNDIKQWLNDYFMKEFAKLNFTPIIGTYETAYVYYYKNKQSDLTNVAPQISKAFLDAAQKAGAVQEDNVSHCIKECYYVGEQDKENPRVEIFLRKYIKDNND